MDWLQALSALEPLVPWLNLGSSFLLALLTLWYVAITAKTLRQSQAVENDRQKRARSEQAAAIAAWVAASVVDDDRVTVSITLKNPTPQPVYGLEVSVHDLCAGELAAKIPTKQLLGPGEERTTEDTYSIPDNASGDLRVLLRFVDSSGLEWIRHTDGALTEVPHSTQAVTSGVRRD